MSEGKWYGEIGSKIQAGTGLQKRNPGSLEDRFASWVQVVSVCCVLRRPIARLLLAGSVVFSTIGAFALRLRKPR